MADETPQTMPTSDEEKYPAVKYAYDFVQPSYTWALTRFEAATTRIQALMTFAATITLGVPTVGTALKVDYRSVWFVAALALFIIFMLIGLIAREYGRLILASPDVLYKSVLDKSEWEFKRYAIYYAGEHSEKNRRLINFRGLLAAVMSALLALETVAWAMWLATARPQ